MSEAKSMMAYLIEVWGRSFVIGECMEACADLVETFQKLNAEQSDENKGFAQADIARVIVWCGVASLLLGENEVSKGAGRQLLEIYKIASRNGGGTNA